MKVAKPETNESPRFRLDLPVADIVPDEDNRKIDDDDDLAALSDSIRVLGVLSPLHVQKTAEGKYVLVDGERRWRAAQKAGLVTVPCEVWQERASASDALVAGVVLNEHRRAHGPVHVARRLHEIKASFGLTAEQVASRTGLPVDRVKNYLLILRASETLLSFFDEQEVALKLAAEFVRYEKSTNEACSRRLVQRHLRSPISRQELIELRRRDETKRRPNAMNGGEDSRPSARQPTYLDQLDRAFRRDREEAKTVLLAVLERWGYRLEPIDSDGVANGN